MPVEPAGTTPPVIMIPEIRDYKRINAELIDLLNRGHRTIRLESAEGQRLIASGLMGTWSATIEIHGWTGPETAANLNAPNLTILANGPSLDGAARGLRAGRVLFSEDVGDAAGACQSGGTLVVSGSSGHRTGLGQAGGHLAIFGASGRLAGERQVGGWIFLRGRPIGPYLGRAGRGGRIVTRFDPEDLDDLDRSAWQECLALRKCLNPTARCSSTE